MKNLLSILFLSQVLNTALFAGLEIKNLETLKKSQNNSLKESNRPKHQCI
jgi:hypothetical protein